MTSSSKRDAWLIDQLAKSELFHQKLHEWGMLEVADRIDRVKGEELEWDELSISDKAWNKAIHQGIKPVIIFAHPHVLNMGSRSVSYYRMLAMVSQKSMNQVGLPVSRYEQENNFHDEQMAREIAQHFNTIISHLVEADEQIDCREFDIWRGMAAGTQAQGSWQNIKGQKLELIIQEMIQNRLRTQNLLANQTSERSQIPLTDGRLVVFADEPDIAIYQQTDEQQKIIAAIEIKGGIDSAGVLERIGAAIKSLSRVKAENPDSMTMLILQEVSVTYKAQEDLTRNQNIVNDWLTIEEIINNAETFIIVISTIKSLINTGRIIRGQGDRIRGSGFSYQRRELETEYNRTRANSGI